MHMYKYRRSLKFKLEILHQLSRNLLNDFVLKDLVQLAVILIEVALCIIIINFSYVNYGNQLNKFLFAIVINPVIIIFA